MLAAYLDAIAMTERLHRQFLEIVKVELESQGMHDLNNVQAMILFNIGELDMTIGELTLRGCYLGSNVSYNVKKMAENGYIQQERSLHDRRSIRVRLTDKGERVRKLIMAMVERHLGQLAQGPLDEAALTQALVAFRRLDRFWTQSLSIGPRLAGLSSAA
ncbi:MAG: MarR family winged helix-turn-helix transcriptional regulator [Stellaceae bacterium]